MNFLANILVSVAGSMAIRVLAALGITLVTYGGISAIFDQLIDLVRSHYNALPVNVLSVLSIAGVGQALGIIGGAYITKALFKSANVFVNKGLSQ